MNAIPLTPAEWVETATVAAIFGGALVLSMLLPPLIGAIVRRFGRFGGPEVADMVVRALRGPVGALILVQAFFGGLTTLSYLEPHRPMIDRLWLAATITVLIVATQRVVTRLTQWYAERSVRGRSRIDPRTVPLLRRALNVLIWVVGGLIVLDTVGVQISPLLAGLGLGGLAVALALQPMLANIFASSYLLSDQSIRVGDAIEMQNGPSGVIEDIGWRATRIRSIDHNLVIVPNSVLAQATMTNFDSAAPGTDVTLLLRVPAEADLAAVERICLDELALLREEATEIVEESSPMSVHYRAVEAGKAEIVLRIRAASWRDSANLKHRMILRLHRRLQSEGVALV